MINIQSYSEDSLTFIENVINSKHTLSNEPTPCYKFRMISLLPDLKPFIDKYDEAHHTNTLTEIIADPKFKNTIIKEDLLKLYSYKTKAFIKLKNKLTELPNNRSFDTCQYCGINSINTLDHILPKTNFPEYVVHPLNLFPACSECNSSKLSKWLDTTGTSEFLNLYTDILPQVQFLFVDLAFKGNSIETNFYLDNPFGIEGNLYSVICNHFANLKLLERFKKKSNEIISEFENTIVSNLTTNNLEQLLNYARNRIPSERARIGYNHYKNILELELCNGAAFKEYLQARGYI